MSNPDEIATLTAERDAARAELAAALAALDEARAMVREADERARRSEAHARAVAFASPGAREEEIARMRRLLDCGYDSPACWEIGREACRRHAIKQWQREIARSVEPVQP